MLEFISGFIVCGILVLVVISLELRLISRETNITQFLSNKVKELEPKQKGAVIRPLQGFNKAYKKKVLDATKDIKLEDILYDEE